VVLEGGVDDVEVIELPASCAKTGPATNAASTAVAARSFIERILKVLSMEFRTGPGRAAIDRRSKEHGKIRASMLISCDF